MGIKPREFRKVDICVLRSGGKVILILVFGELWGGRCEMKWRRWVYLSQNKEKQNLVVPDGMGR